MKRSTYKKFAAVLAAAAAMTLTGCGQDPAPVAAAPGAVGVPGVGVPGGCIPLSSPIPFTGTGNTLAQMGYTSYKLLAGQMPPPPAGTGQVYGQMMLGGGGGGQITRQSANGSITLSLASNTTPTNITGTIQISPAEQQIITSYVMSGQIPLFNTTPVSGTYMYPTYPYTYGTPTQIPAGQQICVSNIAISASIYQYSSGQASFGSVDIAVYLNNTMHGYVLML